MKKTVALALLVLSGFSSPAQTLKPDKIVKLSGETLLVNVSSVTDKEISFTYPGEKVTNTLSKNQVKEIDFASGRVQPMAEKIVITGEQDWAKVLITTVESDAAGLVRKGEVRAKATGATSLSNAANVDARATEKIKREAARLGAHLILLQSQSSHPGLYGLSAAGSLKQGVAYGYQ